MIRAPDEYWAVRTEELLRALESTPEGLPASEAAVRLRQLGPNRLAERRGPGRLGVFLRQFQSPIVLILLAAVALSFLVRHWSDGAILLAIILGSAYLSFRQEYSASAAVEALQSRVAPRATVARDGMPGPIPAEEVVPGDVVLLAAGSLVPADGVILEARDLFVNQAVLTGETYPVTKTAETVPPGATIGQRANCVYQGTSIRSGTARALIVRTGSATEFGAIARHLHLRPPLTAFEHGVRRLGYLLSEATFVLVLAVFAINVAFHRPVLDSLLFSLALAVGLTPQLLPAIVNITLARGSVRMARRGVIVRRLESIEEFGSMDVLCTDKTGTITEGVVRLDRVVDAEGRESAEVFRLAVWNASLQTGLPSPLDDAILAAPAPKEELPRKRDEIPYDFHRKRLSVVVEAPAGPLLVLKGAVLSVLEVCTRVRLGGSDSALDAVHRASAVRRFEEWSAQGLRALAVATRELPPQPSYHREDEHDLVLRGFLLFFDPPKPDVRETLAQLASLGVSLKIVTGDSPLVARHTADAIGLPVAGVLTGAQVDALRDEALWNAADRTTIFAEIDPNQKERIILALRKRGRVVGYMGDGINDAPALHAANLGISVDDAVDVAKEAADFVLLSKDLAVLKEGILEGRTTFANTLKYVFMATSANFGNMFSMAGASLFLPFLPMLPKQILLINFLTDLPEMAIAGDRVDPDQLTRPRRWDVPFIRRFMLVFGPLSSVFDYLTFIVLGAVLHAGEVEFHTGWFVESVVSATLVIFAVRTRLPAHRSAPGRTMALAAVGVAVAAVALPYTPLARPLGFGPLPVPFLAVVAGIVVLYVVSAEAMKRVFFRRETA